MHSVESSFLQGRFAEHTKYTEVNRKLIGLAKPGSVILDLGTGSGTIPALLYEMAAAGSIAQPQTIIAVDPSRERLEEAAQRLAQHRPAIVQKEYFSRQGQELPKGLYLVEGFGQDTPFIPDCSIDTVVMANAIHLVPREELPKLIAEAARVLRQGGRFAANSAYSDGFTVAGTGMFYGKWVAPARKKLEELGILFDNNRKKEIGIINRAECERLMAESGISVVYYEQSRVELDREFYEGIARHDSDFPKGVIENLGAVIKEHTPELLSKISETLASAVGAAMGEKKTIPRNYYWVIGEKAA